MKNDVFIIYNGEKYVRQVKNDEEEVKEVEVKDNEEVEKVENDNDKIVSLLEEVLTLLKKGK